MDTKRIIEVDGVKIEVDLRTAKRVDTLQIGSRVKVLETKSYGGPRVYAGVVVGFEPFVALPTIIVAYVTSSFAKAEVKILHYNAKSEGYELVAALDDDLAINRADVLEQMDAEVKKKRDEIATIEQHRTYFLRHFGRYFTDMEEPVQGKSSGGVDESGIPF